MEDSYTYSPDSFDLEIKWVGSCIFVVSIMYTFLISRLTIVPPTIPTMIAPPDPKRTLRLRSMHADLENRKRRIARTPFPLLDLPPELGLLILSHTAEWPETFANLALVSRKIQGMAYEACLPRMPIRLISEVHVQSFDKFLLCKPHLAAYVQHLWVTPLHEEYYPAAIRILKKCKRVVSLALNGRVLEEAVTSPHVGYRIRHKRCRKLTLLYTARDGWASLLSSEFPGQGSALQFMQQITHLRLVGDVVPAHLPLPSLRVFSYALNRNNLNLVHGERMLKDKESLPSLHSVVLVGERRAGVGGVRITKMKDSRVFVFEVPQARTELEMWCDNTLGKGFWQICAD
ncbi:hypothetical protein DFP72DRAFT_895894 [Ephemerocybe angulata]|uniref:F-box domain-containing protein n=1 Tax=Ephemerocybe angulata TaxID=980116 RepID=A0A8H6M5Y8_9AGAR|nr:hypothetical protein DFP72DRAFT_895894 [Tulosesus angulatus]